MRMQHEFWVAAQWPRPVIVVEAADGPSSIAGSLSVVLLKWGRAGLFAESTMDARGVPLGRLDAVLAQGIDVEPTDAPLYVADLEKAAEYGPVWMVLACRRLRRSYHWVSVGDLPPDTSAIEKEYPYRFDDVDGTWFMRRPAPDFRAQYEVPYGWYVPGDPFDALQAVIVVVPSMPAGLAHVEHALSTSPRRWTGGGAEATALFRAACG